jgi:hypothetical protein
MMDHAESVAKVLIEKLVPGSEMKFRLDQSRSVHDFDLFHADGRVDAVEVTASVDREAEETNAAILDPKKGGLWISTTRCKNDWHIHPEPNARINIIRRHADECLGEIEAAGFVNFFGLGDRDKHPAIQRAYRELRIFSGEVIPKRHLGRISMAPPGGGGAVDASVVHDAVVAEANKKDNRVKLATAAPAARHLAVYVHWQDHAIAEATSAGR